MAYIINLFGEGIRYWVCDIPFNEFNEFEKIKKRTELEWEKLFFDLDFLAHFGYSNWSELSKNQEVKLFLLNNKNKLEIKERNKIVLKIPSINLLNQTSLFDLYSTQTINLNFESKPDCKTVILLQNEIGLIAKYQMEKSSFDIEKLQFQIVNDTENRLNGLSTNIQYEGEKLKMISEDVLVQSMKVIML